MTNLESWIAEGPGFDVWQEQEILASPLRPIRFWSPPSSLSPRYREALFPGIKEVGRESNTHLHVMSIKNAWRHTSILTHTFVCVERH